MGLQKLFPSLVTLQSKRFTRVAKVRVMDRRIDVAFLGHGGEYPSTSCLCATGVIIFQRVHVCLIDFGNPITVKAVALHILPCDQGGAV
jgi:hypothetical protein